MENKTDKKYLTSKDVIERYPFTKYQLDTHVRNGRIKYYKFGKNRLFKEADIDFAIENGGYKKISKIKEEKKQ